MTSWLQTISVLAVLCITTCGTSTFTQTWVLIISRCVTATIRIRKRNGESVAPDSPDFSVSSGKPSTRTWPRTSGSRSTWWDFEAILNQLHFCKPTRVSIKQFITNLMCHLNLFRDLVISIKNYFGNVKQVRLQQRAQGNSCINWHLLVQIVSSDV